LHGAFLAALLDRKKGRGQFVDMSMVDSFRTAAKSFRVNPLLTDALAIGRWGSMPNSSRMSLGYG
jgi:crotonobetainyl-CoA:carnitine CoA-transferase CaiB-like acyl-CoA transferase